MSVTVIVKKIRRLLFVSHSQTVSRHIVILSGETGSGQVILKSLCCWLLVNAEVNTGFRFLIALGVVLR